MYKKILWGIAIALFIVIITFLVRKYYFIIIVKPVVNENLAIDSVETKISRLYGIAVDSFDVEYGRIRRDQTLSTILIKNNVAATKVHQLNISSQGVFDLRKVRAGNDFTLFRERNSLHNIRYFVYHSSDTAFYIFDLADSTHVHEFIKKTTIKTQTAKGIINGSLWNAISESGTNPQVAIKLSEIYAWAIDFFGLQKGDEFKVIYDESFVDTISIEVKHIHCAVFKHNGRDYYAIPFTQKGTESYFDITGESLRKAFLKAPLHFSRISSRYSNSRLHPVLKIRRPHHGVDYAAPIGTPVHAIGDGTVISMGYNGGAGRMVKIRHNSIYTTAYLHLRGYGQGIAQGCRITQGQVIGYVGNSGLSSGPHLDFRFFKYNQPVDPLKVEAPSVEPIQPENKLAFDSIKRNVLFQLYSVK
jgi:murein DD-endopeptidase MepM/ murein hydrolase activator NlpD